MTVFLSFAFCIVLIGLDQLFKFLVTEFLKPIEYIDLIENVDEVLGAKDRYMNAIME